MISMKNFLVLFFVLLLSIITFAEDELPDSGVTSLTKIPLYEQQFLIGFMVVAGVFVVLIIGGIFVYSKYMLQTPPQNISTTPKIEDYVQDENRRVKKFNEKVYEQKVAKKIKEEMEIKPISYHSLKEKQNLTKKVDEEINSPKQLAKKDILTQLKKDLEKAKQEEEKKKKNIKAVESAAYGAGSDLEKQEEKLEYAAEDIIRDLKFGKNKK